MRRTRSIKQLQKYNVDALYFNTTKYLLRDYQTLKQDFTLYQDMNAAIQAKDVKGLRESKPTLCYTDDPLDFKWKYQLQNVDKRYKYRHDIYSTEELQSLATAKYIDVQHRLAGLDWSAILDSDVSKVLRLARKLCTHVLGSYDDNECRTLARFGSGATVGIPARDVNLASRFRVPISGTQAQITWWRQEYDDCPHFQQWLCEEYGMDINNPAVYSVIENLKLTFVPKNHKSLRIIQTNTTIGNYQSLGLGEMIRKRLKSKLGLDIRKLQHKHRDYAKVESVLLRHVTMDLQSASDSISNELMQVLLPDEWYEILSSHRVRSTTLPDNSVIINNTFMTMGIGYTFALQTLVFYSLLWATQAIYGTFVPSAHISVYGDDLIFHRHIYDSVRVVFKQVGITVNEDKTFCDLPFRESCGGDYYCGRDVRPFSPEGLKSCVLAPEYEAMLYKFINGLLQKFEEHEIGMTLAYLASEVERVAGKAKLVPLTHPEDSGIRCWKAKGTCICHSWDFLSHVTLCIPKYLGHGLYRFQFLKKSLKEKEEKRHGPFYWSSLRNSSLDSDSELSWKPSNDRPFEIFLEGYPLEYSSGSSLLVRKIAPINPGKPGASVPKGTVNITRTMVGVPHTGRYRRHQGISGFEIQS